MTEITNNNKFKKRKINDEKRYWLKTTDIQEDDIN